MKNQVFDIIFDRECGGISSLILSEDKEQMNFCREGRALFALRNFILESFEKTGNSAVSVSSFMGVKATTEYQFEREYLTVSISLLNENPYPIYFKNGDIILETPINDAYESSAVCMKERCHAHIWTGLDNSYIRCERMGESDCHLGIVFQNGSFSSYRQEECKHCSRGYLSMNISAFELLLGDTYEIKAFVFAHSGGEDFFEQAEKTGDFLRVRSDRGYTFSTGERVEFYVEKSVGIESARFTVNGEESPCRIDSDKAFCSFVAQQSGEHKVNFEIDGKCGLAVFNIVPSIEDLIRNRLNFIVENQQCKDESSPLFGAYLIYDNEEKRQFFDYVWTDHNANRERMGMSLTIVKWLQRHDDEKLRRSIDIFTEFLLRECVDEDDGTCYGNIGKDKSKIRLYNAPWVMLYFTELYKLTNEKRWIELVVRIVRYYYSVGGAKFYPNGIRFYTMYNAIKVAGMEKEAAEIYDLFNKHVETIIKNGIIYPPHEVNFEQTIVTPAVTILLDKYLISKDTFYLREAEKHIDILQKFDGKQPHYRLNTIPIRYWDDYWFGKNGSYGDVFPHYWSVLSGYGYYLYYKSTRNRGFLNRARQCMMNCLCNYNIDGSATCSYLFPRWVSGTAKIDRSTPRDFFAERNGNLANAFANDQDFALYFLMKMEFDLDFER